METLPPPTVSQVGEGALCRGEATGNEQTVISRSILSGQIISCEETTFGDDEAIEGGDAAIEGTDKCQGKTTVLASGSPAICLDSVAASSDERFAPGGDETSSGASNEEGETAKGVSPFVPRSASQVGRWRSAVVASISSMSLKWRIVTVVAIVVLVLTIGLSAGFAAANDSSSQQQKSSGARPSSPMYSTPSSPGLVEDDCTVVRCGAYESLSECFACLEIQGCGSSCVRDSSYYPSLIDGLWYWECLCGTYTD
jgi:hypothetical protein